MWVNYKCPPITDENSQGFDNRARHQDLQAPTVITAVFAPGIKIYFNARCEESQQSEPAIR